MFILLSIFILPSLVKALPMLNIDYTIYKNDTVKINYIKLIDSTAFIPTSSSEEYKIIIKDFKNQTIYSINIPVIFYVFDFTGGREINSSSGYIRVGWKNTTKYVDFLHYDKIIYSVDLSSYFCNKNGLCEYDKGETVELCPLDCHCGNGICEKILEENYENCPQDCKPEQPTFSFYIYAFLIAIIFVLIFLIFWKSRSVRYESPT
jgi:hypothetical protein